jgi:hypothetical protein
LNIGREDELGKEAATLILAQERLKLESLEEALSLRIRSQYQKYVLGQEAVAQGEENFSAVSEHAALAKSLFTERRITESELAEALAQQRRAEFQLAAARITLQDNEFAAAAAASYLHEQIDRRGE